jgi:tetratricopeptide (TPR) repeat protein
MVDTGQGALMARKVFLSHYNPNNTAPEHLEAIFVQSERLAQTWFNRLRESALTGTKHHLLAVGPRGCGKSHLVNLLVHRLEKDPQVASQVRIAWLPEDEATTCFSKLLLRILRALNARYAEEFPLPPRTVITKGDEEQRAAALIRNLLDKLGSHSLLLVVENLDDVMHGLGSEGQKRWRAFLQEHPVTTTLATSQQLTNDFSDRDRPFFNFFQVEHLPPLSADDAVLLLAKIAELNEDAELAAFLRSSTGRARVRAIRHVTGGSHRVFLMLSEFITREDLDNLVSAFQKLLDDLTPYYQERLRWLANQQREIVEFLCRQTHTVTVKQTAAELQLTAQTTSAQLKSLKEKGYVTFESVGRESRYELAEPLMRLCVQVKDPRREPIRLIVDFLRIWYDRPKVQSRLQCLPPDADLPRQYLEAALKAAASGEPHPLLAALERDLAHAKATGNRDEQIRILIEQADVADSPNDLFAAALGLFEIGRDEDALAAFDRAIELDPKDVRAWIGKGFALKSLGRYPDSLVAHDRVIELDPNFANVWVSKGDVLRDLGRHEEALAAFHRVIELDSKHIDAWVAKGKCLLRLGRYDDGLTAFDQALELEPNLAGAWLEKGNALEDLNRFEDALTAFARAAELNPKYAKAWVGKGHSLWHLGRHEDALVASDKAVEHCPNEIFCWIARSAMKTALGQIQSAIDDLKHAIGMDSKNIFALEYLTEAYILQGNWPEAERVLLERFQLPFSPRNNITGIITAIFQVTPDRKLWLQQVGRIAAIAAQAEALTLLGDALVQSLTHQRYRDAAPATRQAWADIWKDATRQHPDLSLSVRLFQVGIRYLETKNPREFLDLVQEERAILIDLFKPGPGDAVNAPAT